MHAHVFVCEWTTYNFVRWWWRDRTRTDSAANMIYTSSLAYLCEQHANTHIAHRYPSIHQCHNNTFAHVIYHVLVKSAYSCRCWMLNGSTWNIESSNIGRVFHHNDWDWEGNNCVICFWFSWNTMKRNKSYKIHLIEFISTHVWEITESRFPILHSLDWGRYIINVRTSPTNCRL